RDTSPSRAVYSGGRYFRLRITPLIFSVCMSGSRWALKKSGLCSHLPAAVYLTDNNTARWCRSPAHCARAASAMKRFSLVFWGLTQTSVSAREHPRQLPGLSDQRAHGVLDERLAASAGAGAGGKAARGLAQSPHSNKIGRSEAVDC